MSLSLGPESEISILVITDGCGGLGPGYTNHFFLAEEDRAFSSLWMLNPMVWSGSISSRSLIIFPILVIESG
eukprot:UN04093